MTGDPTYPFFTFHPADLPRLLYEAKNVSFSPGSYIDWAKVMAGQWQKSTEQQTREYGLASQNIASVAKDTFQMQGNLINALQEKGWDNLTEPQRDRLIGTYRNVGHPEISVQLEDLRRMEIYQEQQKQEEEDKKRKIDEFYSRYLPQKLAE